MRSDGQVLVADEQTKDVYLLVDASTMNVLQRQQDLEAIREGIADVEAGRVARVNGRLKHKPEPVRLPSVEP